MTFHWHILFVCLLNQLYTCQRTFRIYKNDRNRIFFPDLAPLLLYFAFVVPLGWVPGLVQYLSVCIFLFLFFFVFNHLLLYPLLILIAKDGFWGSSHRSFNSCKICSGTSLCIPCALLCQYVYHFSITVLGQDKTFTIPRSAVMWLFYHPSPHSYSFSNTMLHMTFVLLRRW